MAIKRRRLLIGAALATATTAGCVQRGWGEADGGGDDGGNEPTTAIPEEPRVDEPPYDVEEQPRDPDAWNQLYLCENMPSASDLEVQQVSAPRADRLLSTHDADEDAYAVRALTSADEVREVFDVEGDDERDDEADDEEPEGPLDATDFDEYVLLVVEDGYGSGSVTHHWARAERTDRGLRLHGCLVQPFERTDDVTARHSVVRVERPDDIEVARVGLTVDEDSRVHFNSTEGVVGVEGDG